MRCVGQWRVRVCGRIAFLEFTHLLSLLVSDTGSVPASASRQCCAFLSLHLHCFTLFPLPAECMPAAVLHLPWGCRTVTQPGEPVVIRLCLAATVWLCIPVTCVCHATPTQLHVTACCYWKPWIEIDSICFPSLCRVMAGQCC